jgi:uncharacterized protein (DUF983 family)
MFKNDWTPGIFPIVAGVGLVVALALWMSTFFENYPEWVSVTVFVIVIALATIACKLTMKRKIIRNKRKGGK